MTYPFVAAESWSRDGAPVRAVVIHMAEGGGTVNWLTRPDGNSSHYVVEYSGRVVQMVQESRAAGSINPAKLRTTDDAWFEYLGRRVRYGVTAAKAALGTWWSDPNRAVIAIEVEGYAATGPNGTQRTALARLVADIRSRHDNVAALCHRDFQDYKACPGRRIPWADYGNHGKYVAPTETDVPILSAYIPGQVAVVKASANVRSAPSLRATVLRVVATPESWTVTGWTRGDVDPDSGSDQWVCRWANGRWEYTAKANLSSGPAAPPDPTPYTQAAVNAAVAAAVAPYEAVLTARTTALRAIAAEASAAATTPPHP